MQKLIDMGFRAIKPDLFVKEWDSSVSQNLTDTSIAIGVDNGKVDRVLCMTDELRSSTGSYYTAQSAKNLDIECTESFIAEIINAAKDISNGDSKKWKALFSTPVKQHIMS